MSYTREGLGQAAQRVVCPMPKGLRPSEPSAPAPGARAQGHEARTQGPGPRGRRPGTRSQAGDISPSLFKYWGRGDPCTSPGGKRAGGRVGGRTLVSLLVFCKTIERSHEA